MSPLRTAGCALLLCILAACVPQATWRSHDALEGCTSVIGRVFLHPEPGGGSLALHLRVMIRDSTPAAAVEEGLMMLTVDEGPDGASFTEDAELVLLLDGSTRLRYQGRGLRDSPSQTVRDGVVARRQYRVPAADLARIAAASRVEGSIGARRFTLSDRELENFRRHVGRMTRPGGAEGLPWGDGLGLDCDSDQGPANST